MTWLRNWPISLGEEDHNSDSILCRWASFYLLERVGIHHRLFLMTLLTTTRGHKDTGGGGTIKRTNSVDNWTKIIRHAVKNKKLPVLVIYHKIRWLTYMHSLSTSTHSLFALQNPEFRINSILSIIFQFWRSFHRWCREWWSARFKIFVWICTVLQFLRLLSIRCTWVGIKKNIKMHPPMDLSKKKC